MRKVAAVGEAGYQRIARDNYRTPDWVTAHLLRHFKFDGFIWEPAAGVSSRASSSDQ